MKTFLIISLLICATIAQEETEIEETTTELCDNSTVESCEAFNVSETSVDPEPAVDATKAPILPSKPSKPTSKSATKKPTVVQNSTSPQQSHADCTCDTIVSNTICLKQLFLT